MKLNQTRLAGRIITGLAAVALLATCIYILVTSKSSSAAWPAIGAGILGYIILKSGKRTAKITMGGVVVEIMSDDTGVINTATGSVMTHISREISEGTRTAAIEATKK